MYVVTGGAGFIGSNVVAALVERGAGVAVCDRMRDGDKWRNLAKRELVDIVQPEHLFEFLDQHSGSIDAVVHMGAISATTERDVDLIVAVNLRLSLGLWHWCARNRVPFIYASSAATYGGGDEGFDDDSALDALAKLRPLNPYGWSKHLFDRRVARMVMDGEGHPPQWAGLKFFNVFGPNEYHKESQKSVVAQVFASVAAGHSARLFKSHRPDYPDGGQKRDFVWVGDCVDVILWLLDNQKVSGLFNCGSGKARSFAELATAVFHAVGREPKIDYVPTPEAIRDRYQYFTEAKMQRLRAAGYAKPFTSLEDGVGMYVKDYLAKPDPYR